MKWEYKILPSMDERVPRNNRAYLEEELNDQGEREWEVCGVLNLPQDIGGGTLVAIAHVILKREWVPPQKVERREARRK